MTPTALAVSLGFNKSTGSLWRRRSWLVFNPDGSLDVDASKARLTEKRGHLGPLTKREQSLYSSWRREPACKTYGAFEAQRQYVEANGR